jgi:murein DD-endopeptidase MepM/ murein hydrolase activator NlpD
VYFCVKYVLRLMPAILLFALIACNEASKETGSQSPADTLTITPACMQEYRLQRGGTLAGLLQKEIGFSAKEALQITRELGRKIDLRKMQARDRIFHYWWQGSEQQIIQIDENLDDYYWQVTTAPDNNDSLKLIVEKRGFQRRSEDTIIAAEISSSLFLALSEHLPAQVIYTITDILQWDIDFFTDPRPGDKVVIWLRQTELIPGERKSFTIRGVKYFGARDTVNAILEPVSGSYYDASGRALRKTFLRSPLNYRRISSGFQKRRFHPIKKIYRPHHGVDFAAPRGTPVAAAADGRVVFKGWKNGYGNTLILRHGQYYRTLYGHLYGYNRGLRVGAKVMQGEIIAYVGKSGTATGYHLHYTVYDNGRPIDPLTMRNPGGPAIADSLRSYFLPFSCYVNNILLADPSSSE